MISNKRKAVTLAAACAWIGLGIGLTVAGKYEKTADDFNVKIEAATLHGQMMNEIKEYKNELGIPLVEEDIHKTGMIGEPYTEITTTHGAIEAKRTTANPDMAAVVVQMLEEAGMKEGSRVAIGFSGSFPAMNLAVLSACETMNLDYSYIASVGASTYGANQPDCTFPDMVLRLYHEGYIERLPEYFTFGGRADCGYDMNPELRDGIYQRLIKSEVEVVEPASFPENIEQRRAAYEAEGMPECFVAVGGNYTNSGPGDKDIPYGVIKPGKIRTVDENSGLIQVYNSQDLPIINILNIKKLVTDYGLAFDPESLKNPGESAIYKETAYPMLPAAVGILGAVMIILVGFGRLRKVH